MDSEFELEVQSWIDFDLEGIIDKEDKVVDDATYNTEGLVDVHINVDNGVQKILEGSMEVGVGLSEHSNEEDNENTIVNRNDRGLFDNDWQSKDLVTCQDSDSDTKDVIGSSSPFGTFFMPKSMVDYKWDVVTTFIDKHQFTGAVRTYDVKYRRNLKFLKNDKESKLDT